MDSSDDQSIEYKGSKWFLSKTRITGLINQVTITNTQLIAREIMNANLYHGRGLFCQAIMKFQTGLPQFTNIYAATVAVINPEFPDVGYLLVKRLVLQFKEAYDSKNKQQMLVSSKFLAHLVNQLVICVPLAEDILLYLLLVNPSSDNVEVAVNFCLQCGSLLQDILPHKFEEVFKEFRRVLNEGRVEKRVQVLILKLFASKKSKFWRYPDIIDGLDLVGYEDQVTHEITMLQDLDPETDLDDFKPDLEFEFEYTSLTIDGN